MPTTNDNLDPTHVAWSRNLFAGLAEGGSWAMPRCGLIFVKRGKELHLTLRMPYDPAMPMTADELRDYQQSDFESVKANFGGAGVTVVDKTKEPVT